MAYRVLGANVSPFVRKVRAFLAEKGVEYELEQVNPFDIGEQRRLGGIAHDSHQHSVEDAGAALDDVEVTLRRWVEATGHERGNHGSSFTNRNNWASP